MKCYYRIGSHIEYSTECFAGGYIGLHSTDRNLTELTQNGREWFDCHAAHLFADPDAGTGHATADEAWAFLHVLKVGDVIFYPPGWGRSFRVGVVTSDYFHRSGEKLQHRRAVKWLPMLALRASRARPENPQAARFTAHDWLGGSADMTACFDASSTDRGVTVNDYPVSTLKVDRFAFKVSRYLRVIGELVCSDFLFEGAELDGPIFIIGHGMEHPLQQAWALIVVPPLANYPAHLMDDLG